MKNKKQRINIINMFIITIIIGIIVGFCVEEYKEIKNTNYEIENKINKNINIVKTSTKEMNEKEEKKYPKEEIINTYKGYNICAKLQIPEISVETYVISEYSKTALDVSSTKYWGPEPNEIGNFCIAGHNIKNMFYNLKKLQTGSKMFLSDNKIGKVEYEVYDIYKVNPKDVSVLNQNTKKREITLITCTNDSSQRLIIKASEI